MICPKCQGTSIFDHPSEKPKTASSWKRCFSCGKQWDPEAPSTSEMLETIRQAVTESQIEEDARRMDDEEDDEEQDGDDLSDLEPEPTAIELAMKDVRVQRGRPKKEKPMPKFISEEHRQNWIDGQRRSRELKRQGKAEENKPGKKPGRRKKEQGGGAAHKPAPAQAVAVVNGALAIPVRRVDPAGQTLQGIDAAISQHQQELRALEVARSIIARRA